MRLQPCDQPVVDLVIPALNEEANVLALLAAVPRRCLRHVVLADNGSTDHTAERARAGGAVVVHEPRRGYGSACLAGLRWIADQGQPPHIVAFLDADLADDPTLLPSLLEPIATDRADLVIASRLKHAEPGALTTPQRLCNTLSCAAIRLATGCRVTDLGPMRAIRWASLQQLHMQDTTWGWTVEMQFKAAAYGLRVTQIDAPYRRRHAGKSKISRSLTGSVRAGCKITTTLARLWWQTRRAPCPTHPQPGQP